MTSPFSEIISPFLPDLRSYCMQLVSGSSWDAEDLAQESLIKVHKALAQSSDRKITKAYLYRIARTTWIDMYRKQNRKHILQADAGEHQEYHDHQLLVRESLELLACQLTAHQTVLIILVDVFFYTAKEAAQLIHSTEGAVKEALKRARKRLNSFSVKQDIQDESTKESQQQTRQSFAWIEQLLHGFQSANPYAIANAYLSIRSQNILLRNVQRSGETLFFTFRDPDGHLLTFTTNIFFRPVSFAPSSSV